MIINWIFIEWIRELNSRVLTHICEIFEIFIKVEWIQFSHATMTFSWEWFLHKDSWTLPLVFQYLYLWSSNISLSIENFVPSPLRKTCKYGCEANLVHDNQVKASKGLDLDKGPLYFLRTSKKPLYFGVLLKTPLTDSEGKKKQLKPFHLSCFLFSMKTTVYLCRWILGR